MRSSAERAVVAVCGHDLERFFQLLQGLFAGRHRVQLQVDDEVQVASQVQRKRAGQLRRRHTECHEVERGRLFLLQRGLGPAEVHQRFVDVQQIELVQDIRQRVVVLFEQYEFGVGHRLALFESLDDGLLDRWRRL
jgi:hypothetical protein